MALSGTARGTNTHNTSATSFTLNSSGNFAASSWAVLLVAADNSASGGAAHGTFTVTDTLSNTWTRRQQPLYDPGAANAGITGGIFTTPQNGGAIQTGTTITVSFGSDSTTAKVWALWEVTTNGTIIYVTGGVNTGSATTTPTVTTGSIESGDMVIGGSFNEQGTSQTHTGDADSSNGNWSTQQTNKIGTTAAGVSLGSQWKVTTGTATQTYDPTLAVSSDVILSYIVLHQVVNTTVTPSTASLTTTTFAPTVTVAAPQLVTPSTASLTTATFAPTIAHTITGASPTALSTATFAPTIAHKIVGASPTALATSTFAPTISVTDHKVVTPTTASTTTSTFAPTVTASDHKTVTPDVAALASTSFAPTVTASDHQSVTPTTASLATAAFAPTVTASDHKIVIPDVAALTTATFAPAINIGVNVTPAAGILALATFAPVATWTDNQLVTPDAAVLSLSAFAPGVATPQTFTPSTAALILAAFAPKVVEGGPITSIDGDLAAGPIVDGELDAGPGISGSVGAVRIRARLVVSPPPASGDLDVD